MPFAASVRRARQADPGAVAVRLDGAAITYGQLAMRSSQVARAVAETPRRTQRALGRLEIPRLTAVLTDNAPELPELLVGSTSGDAACALLDPRWSVEQTVDVLDRLEPDLLVTQEAHRRVAAAASDRGIGVVLLGSDPADPQSYTRWLAPQQDLCPEQELRCGEDDSVFLVGFTSGSTSVPKAFAMTRGSWRASLPVGAEIFGSAEAVTAAPGPLQHGVALYALAEALFTGATFVGARRFDAADLIREVRTHEIRRLCLVPSMLHALHRALPPGHPPLETVTVCTSSGAHLGKDLITTAARVLPNARFVDYYGASELGCVSVHESPPGGVGTSVRRYFPGVEVEVRNEHGEVCPPGVAGQICVRSSYLSRGYLWGGGSGSFLDAQGWATVGDGGWCDEAGELHLSGRAGSMIITGGWNVYPEEVEDVLRTVPGVDDVVVAGLPDDLLGEVVVAVIGCVDRGDLPPHATVVRACRARLPSHKVPGRIYLAASLPRSSSGKVARSEVVAWLTPAGPADHRLVELLPSTTPR